MNRHSSLLSIVFTVLCVSAAAAQTFAPTDAVEQVGPGTVNWTTGEVFATGIGAPPTVSANPAQARAMAERAAHVVALRNLLESVKGVRVDSQTIVDQFMVKSDVIRVQVDGVVKGARTIRTQYLSDGSVEITVGMLMRGAFMNAIVPQTFGISASSLQLLRQQPPKREEPVRREPQRPLPPSPTVQKPAPSTPAQPAQKAAEPTRTEPPAPPAKPSEPTPAAPEKKAEPSLPVPPAPTTVATAEEPARTDPSLSFKGGVATGVVIDGRGLGLRPALLPRIVDPQGDEVYVGQIVTRSSAVEQGVAGYAKDVNAASNNFRVTDNPAVIKGIRAAGDARTDVMIAQVDARTLRDLAQRGEFLQNCRVIIVY